MIASFQRISLLVALLLIAGCTNSKLIVSPLYNRLDNTLRSQFTELASFDDAQQDTADRLIGTFHVWHRQSELPAYAELMDAVQMAIRQPESVTQDTLSDWFSDAEALGNRIRSCHPINFAAPLIRTMSDKQVADMQDSILEERAEDRQEYAERPPAERRERRLDRFDTWASRIGVNLNAEQTAMLRAALERQISMRQEYFRSSDVWINSLFRLLGERNAADFDSRFADQLQGLGQWLQRDYPDKWEKNRALWRGVMRELVNSLTPQQSRSAADWIAGMAGTLRSVAADEPSFQVSGREEDGCQVGDGPVAEGV